MDDSKNPDPKRVLKPDVLDVISDSPRAGQARAIPRLDADEFILGVGTPFEQSIRWPPELHLREYFAFTDEKLRRLHEFFKQPARQNNLCLVEGIWLVWVYAAIDVKNLYEAIGEVSDIVKAQQATIDKQARDMDEVRQAISEGVNEEFAAMRAEIETLRGDVCELRSEVKLLRSHLHTDK